MNKIMMKFKKILKTQGLFGVQQAILSDGIASKSIASYFTRILSFRTGEVRLRRMEGKQR